MPKPKRNRFNQGPTFLDNELRKACYEDSTKCAHITQVLAKDIAILLAGLSDGDRLDLMAIIRGVTNSIARDAVEAFEIIERYSEEAEVRENEDASIAASDVIAQIMYGDSHEDN